MPSAFGFSPRAAGISGRKFSTAACRKISTAAACIALASPGQALALWGDQLELFATEAITYDSNVFRLDSGVNPPGNSKKSDWSSLTSVGFNLNVPIGRQRVQAGYSYDVSRYDRFSQLDFDGHQGRALWLWELGNELNGQLGYTETKALANFSNFRASILTAANPLKTDRAFFTANYLVTPSWRLSVGADGAELRNGDPARRVNDVDISGFDAGVTYIARSGNSLGLALRTEDGHYPNSQVVAGIPNPVNNSYTQRSANILLDWTFSAQSHLAMRGGWVDRKYDQVPGRNFDDPVGRVQFDWSPTVRLKIAAIALKEISPLEDIQTSFVLIRGFSLRPSWQITEKTNLSLSLDTQERKYLGDPGLVAGTAPQRTDKIYGALLTLTWLPLRNVQVIGTALRESRNSNLSGGDYDVTVISARARIAF